MVKIEVKSYDEDADQFHVNVDTGLAPLTWERVDSTILRLAVRESFEPSEAIGRTFEVDDSEF